MRRQVWYVLGFLCFFSSTSKVMASAVIGYMAGNDSCRHEELMARGPKGMSIYSDYLLPLIEAYQNEHMRPIHWFISCFKRDKILYYLSTQSEKMLLVDEEEKDLFFQDIQKLLLTTHTEKFVLLGHSHGGWLAMKGVLAIQQPTYLFTLDPISRINCRVSKPKDCTSFPQDISQRERYKLKAYTRKWFNYYQTQTLILHSGPVLTADFNLKIPRSHRSMKFHQHIWTIVKNVLGGAVNRDHDQLTVN